MMPQVNLYATRLESEVLVFRTNINTEEEVKMAGKVLDRHFSIQDWSVDTEDIDNVLRIVTAGYLSEGNIVKMLSIQGFFSEAL